MTDPDIVDIVTLLRGADRPEPYLCAAAADEIEKLRKERDEARRMWCEAEAVGNCLSVDDMYRRARTEAKRRGWDCFDLVPNDIEEHEVRGDVAGPEGAD